MRQRCSNPHVAYWRIYGGKGIKIDPRWDDFAVFLKDMGPRPPGYSIERRDNTGDYTPENCYWASPLQQSRNTSHCRYITWNGETKPISEWSEITGVNRSTIYKRLNRGMSVEDALTKPPVGTADHSHDWQESFDADGNHIGWQCTICKAITWPTAGGR
jgi:hypothetical protein